MNATNDKLVDDKVFDLLGKLLTVDHTLRITAREAIQHPYFDEVRDLSSI